jgi:hypothetical protein
MVFGTNPFGGIFNLSTSNSGLVNSKAQSQSNQGLQAPCAVCGVDPYTGMPIAPPVVMQQIAQNPGAYLAAGTGFAAFGALPFGGLFGAGEATIGDLFAGFGENTMIHLTPFAEADFAAGIEEGTYFARLGDVSDMTVSAYRTTYIGPAAAGYSANANMFMWVGSGSAEAFEGVSAEWTFSGIPEYTTRSVLSPGGFLRVPAGW